MQAGAEKRKRKPIRLVVDDFKRGAIDKERGPVRMEETKIERQGKIVEEERVHRERMRKVKRKEGPMQRQEGPRGKRGREEEVSMKNHFRLQIEFLEKVRITDRK